MTAARHADFEAVSAYVDGEAPEWADHVAGCPACRSVAEEIRSVRAVVAAPADPPAPTGRDAAIAAAIGTFSSPEAPATQPVDARPRPLLAPERPVAGHRWAARPWAVPAVAAVIIAVLGLSGLVLTSYRSSDGNGTLALESDAKAGGGAGVAAAAPTAPPADLGDIPDAATLRGRAQASGVVVGSGQAGVAGPALGRTGPSSNSGAQSDATVSGAAPNQSSAPNPGATPTAGAGNSGNPIGPGTAGGGTASATGGGPPLSGATAPANVVGTRPCEERARSRDASLGPVSYFATARQGTVPAYVLGFSPAPGKSGPGITLLLLSQSDCAELLRVAGP